MAYAIGEIHANGEVFHLTTDSDPLEVPWGGVAAHGNTPFDCKLITKLTDTLWMGGCIDGLALPAEIEYVVSLYPWEKYRREDRVDYREFKLYDAALEDPTPYLTAARLVNEFRAKGVTFVHCQAGLNRSGFVTALALILDGMTPDDAISFLREKRTPAVLCNPTFEAWLRDEAPAAIAA